MGTPNEQLGQHIKERMAELGYTVEGLSTFTKQLDETGKGLSTRMLSILRTGNDDRDYDLRTLALLERCLQWKAGSCRTVLTGGEPQERSDVDDLTLSELARDVRELRTRLDRLARSLGEVGLGAL